jgi:Big-like domain-containing protein
MKSPLAVSAAILLISTACGSSTDPNSVATISLSPSTANLVAGSIQQTQLAATIKSADGTVMPGLPIVWATSDKNIAIVSATGLVRAVGTGTATITATSEGKTGAATIIVVPMTESLTGVWISSGAGPLSNLQLQLTEAGSEAVTGQWSGYAADCTPSNSVQCQLKGAVVGGYRHGSSAQVILAPSSSCGVADATILLMFARFDSLSGLMTQHMCNGTEAAPVPAIFVRVP